MMIVVMTLLTGIVFNSCEKIKGKGDSVTETREVSGYSGIGLAISATLYFSSGPDYSLEIQGQPNVLERILTRVEGNTLVIRLKSGIILGVHDPIRIYVTAPDVHDISISGSGDIYVDNLWSGSDLWASISGSGNISVSAMETGRFNGNISGSGNIRVLGGLADQEYLKISGSGDINMQYVEAGIVYTVTSGSGDMYVNALNILDVTISGSGDVFYLGNPAINTHISGSGSVRKL